MNNFISPSNNPLLAKPQTSISTQFGKKNKNFKTLISFCCQTLFLILSVHFTKKYYYTLIKNFETAFSLVLYLVCMQGKRGREGAGQLNSSTGFQNLTHYFCSDGSE